MPRRGRAIVGDLPYHIINRAAGRVALFSSPGDYDAFEDLVALALARLPLRVLAYSVMPNHWHFVVWPRQEDGSDVSRFFHWLTMSHTQRLHAARRTVGTGPLYQGRFKCFPIERNEHLVTVLRYVERNPLRAGLCQRLRRGDGRACGIGRAGLRHTVRSRGRPRKVQQIGDAPGTATQQ